MDPEPVDFDDFGDFAADCPARIALDLFASRWTPIIVYTLRGGPMRPGRLQATIGGISHKVLTQRCAAWNAPAWSYGTDTPRLPRAWTTS